MDCAGTGTLRTISAVQRIRPVLGGLAEAPADATEPGGGLGGLSLLLFSGEAPMAPPRAAHNGDEAVRRDGLPFDIKPAEGSSAGVLQTKKGTLEAHGRLRRSQRGRSAPTERNGHPRQT